MEPEFVTATITVVKAAGPGWLIIAETIEAGRYRMVRELVGEEPVTDEIMKFIDRLPRKLARIEGAEVELKKSGEPRRVSPKRAARQAGREVAEAHDPGRFKPTRSMQLKSAEIETAKACGALSRTFELSVWVRYGKKRAALLEEKHGGLPVVELNRTPSDSASNRMVAVTLARHFNTTPERVELLHGYANPRKCYRITVPA